jgi:hypothetical protein
MLLPLGSIGFGRGMLLPSGKRRMGTDLLFGILARYRGILHPFAYLSFDRGISYLDDSPQTSEVRHPPFSGCCSIVVVFD